jgi:hypothetical protein
VGGGNGSEASVAVDFGADGASAMAPRCKKGDDMRGRVGGLGKRRGANHGGKKRGGGWW